MANVLVRAIPDEVHAVLQQRVRRRGQSLQQYLTGELTRLASQPSVDELFERIECQRGRRVGFRSAVDDLHGDRANR